VYRELPWTLPLDRLAQLQALTARLDCAPGPGGSRCTDFTTTQAVYEPVLRDLFPGRWTRAMVVVLYPSAQLVAHRDPPIEGIRYHLPLQLNPGCWVFHAGVWRQLAEGHVYEMDPTEEHGAVNWGATTRMQLAIDVVTA
jgi:hypothetical protein